MYFTAEISCFFVVSFLVRLGIMLFSWNDFDRAGAPLFSALGFGFLMDFAAAVFVYFACATLTIFIPNFIRRIKPVQFIGSFIFCSILCFSVVGEALFWNEYKTRFNFIAVDYLIYTTEVINNIIESFPMKKILIGIGSAALLLTLINTYVRKRKHGPIQMNPILNWLWSLLAATVIYLLWPYDGLEAQNRYNYELSKNGVYSLFSAFWNNEIDFDHPYRSIPEKIVWSEVEKYFKQIPGTEMIATKEHPALHRTINHGPEKRYNVVLIAVESLSAKFIGVNGNKNGITPHLDKLTRESLFLNNLFATGTRTDRGMEALTLSLPPTPGRSIVKRPKNENLLTVGHVFKKRGYDTKFIYGGYGYFDNMNYYYGNNDFDIVDRGQFKDKEQTFATAWGVSDQDLFNKTLKESDKSYKAKKPFFSFVMTTTNHRPYNYPNGFIDIPSGKSREGAVKYTDYAIHEFLQSAKQKPWFKNTLFVIVADHCATSAGHVDLPPTGYEIPAWFYAPSIIKPAVHSKMTSQLDIVPTILDILNWTYESSFFGQSIYRNINSDHEHAFIGTYQRLGYLTPKGIIILSPQKKINSYQYFRGQDSREPIASASLRESLAIKTISYYQGASLLFKRGGLKNHEVEVKEKK
ncbi:MAG: sulfatase-like hydrolase/transferase [Proteobacteria bacterium]|nr:sulfatase-like hydrolase/transferase [Pseudomonadota bacterium]